MFSFLKKFSGKYPDFSQNSDEYQIYLLWKSGSINNERKFLAWIRTGIGLLTLGFIVERVELFLYTANKTGKSPHLTDLPLTFHLITLAFFTLAAIIIIIATLEFFRDRKRLNRIVPESNVRINVLIISTLILLLIISVIFILEV